MSRTPARRAASGAAASLLLLAPLHAASVADAGSEKPEWVDVTSAAGIAWGPTRLAGGAWNLVETMGGGGGFVDFDRDGWLDVYLVAYTLEPQPGAPPPRDALYRNLGDGRFEDVGDRIETRARFRGMGLAVGDYDADGWPDLYVSGYGAHRLLRNDEGHLRDATALLPEPPAWGASAAFLDYDGDGDLDLFVSSYLDVDPDGEVPCQMIQDRPFCAIGKFRGSPSALYRNDGPDGFSDVSAEAGVAIPGGKGLGVAVADLDGDGWLDVFEANDTSPNHLFRNRGDGRFEEVGLLADVAFDETGRTRGAMGVDVADHDGDGLLEIFVTNFTHETNSFFHNQGGGVFRDSARQVGLALVSAPMSGFGARFLDEDNDGRLDLAVANGHPFEPVSSVWPGITWAEPPFLFENAGGSYREAAAERGDALARPLVGRGLATGDWDNDGDPDLLLLAAGEPPRLLRNDGGDRNHWLGVELVGAGGNRDAVGAVVRVVTPAGRSSRVRAGGTSYLSASDPRLLFGLGGAGRVEQLEVLWPGGTRQVVADVEVDRYVTVRQERARHAESGGLR